MDFVLIDWLIVFFFFAFLIYSAAKSAKYSRNVLDFLAANRSAGPYLLGNAEGVAGMGAISVVLILEMAYSTGPISIFWGQISSPIWMLLALSGWVIYRFRKTGALTMAQFFEMRYSRKFRVFAGIVSWFAGIINFGIFPAVGTRFFISFCNLPDTIIIANFSLSTQATLMACLLLVSLYFTFIGGQVTILITDFLQSVLTLIVFFVISLILFFTIPCEKISEGFIFASKPGYSVINPFDIKDADFNIWFFLISWFFVVYQHMAWQGSQAFNCSAVNAHEAKMAKIVGNLRANAMLFPFVIIPFVAIAVMHNPYYSDIANRVSSKLLTTYPDNLVYQRQMVSFAVLSQLLPWGIKGALATSMLAFFVCNMETYLHSWGSIFIQDVIVPLRKKPIEASRHIFWLRISIIMVAIFVYIFSLVFPLKDYIYMFFQITGAIYLGGAGAVIIGGLYWKRGTTAGAWTAMIIGSVSSVGAIFIQLVWKKIPYLTQLNPEFPFNGQIMAFFAAILGITSYIIVSLLDKPLYINMDKLFHRGKYSSEGEKFDISCKYNWFWRLVGINTNEFSIIDKLMCFYVFAVNMLPFASVVLILIIKFMGLMSESRWLLYWKVLIIFYGISGFVCTAWILTGGFVDFFSMLKRLKVSLRNDHDDGRVSEDFKL